MSFRHSIVSFVLLLVTNMLSNVSAQVLPPACGGSSVRYGALGLPNSTFVWTVNGGTIIADYNDSIDILWDNANVPGTISYHEVTVDSCMSSEQIGYVNVTAFNLDLEDGQGFCYGDSLELGVGTFDTIIWNGSVFSETLWVYDAGWVNVYAKDLYGCSGSDTSFVDEYSLPVPVLYAGGNPAPNDTFICGFDYLDLDAGTGYVYYNWNSGDNSQIVTVYPGDYRSYIVTVEDYNTCTGSDTVNILPCDADWISDQIPNTITPDGDHPAWNFDEVEFAIATIRVFDRTGRLVWECDGYCSGEFDGRNLAGRELPMDSYFYVITLREGIGQITGTITVIR